jgi:ribonuclease HII
LKLKPFLTSQLEAGCDEAGRGCLAGPVVASAVILPKGYYHKHLNDSKKLSEKIREELKFDIKENAVAWAVGIADVKEIDEINILQASILAMHRAVRQLSTIPSYLAIDGNKFNPYPKIKHNCIIKGDGKYMNIAAASVLAKTHRDEIMRILSADFPTYNWRKNKGYPTKEHRLALLKEGKCLHHRTSFQLIPKQINLNL